MTETKRMTEEEHAWAMDGHDNIGNTIERCGRCGIRKIEGCSTFWQRAKGARWRDTEDEDMPPCRAHEEEKDAQIKALADALAGARAALNQNKTFPADVALARSIIDAALRLAKRIP